MYITRTPLRVSFLGGGSDYLPHFREHGGAVLATAIDKFIYVTVGPYNSVFHGNRYKLSYSKTEITDEIESIAHPAIREAIRLVCPTRAIELHHIADLPACTGLGTSSSFVSGMLMALYAICGRLSPMDQLAKEAIAIERDILREAGGYQDQVTAAYGGTNLIEFAGDGDFHVSRLPIGPQRARDVEAHCLLLYTGIRRNSFVVAEKQVKRNGNGENTALLNRLAELAREGAAYLSNGKELEGFGELLHEGWVLKKRLGEVSLPVIDESYEMALKLGVTGGKLLGAGQGGFLLLWAHPSRHAAILDKLGQTMVPLNIMIGAPGSTIIHSN